jgi:hypothetical protein
MTTDAPPIADAHRRLLAAAGRLAKHGEALATIDLSGATGMSGQFCSRLRRELRAAGRWHWRDAPCGLSRGGEEVEVTGRAVRAGAVIQRVKATNRMGADTANRDERKPWEARPRARRPAPEVLARRERAERAEAVRAWVREWKAVMRRWAKEKEALA